MGINGASFLHETDIFYGIGIVLVFIEPSRIQRAFFRCTGTLTIYFPGTGIKDSFFIDLHPVAYFMQNFLFFFVYATVSLDRNVKQQVTIFTDNINKHMDDLFTGL